MGYCAEHAGILGNGRTDIQTGGQSKPHSKWLAYIRKILSVEELETLPAGTDEAKAITPSIVWRRERKRSTKFFLARVIASQTNCDTGTV